MSFRIPHPSNYAYCRPSAVPDGFYVKCYPIYRFTKDNASGLPVDYWEIDYDLSEKSVNGLYRYEQFGSFSEAALKCATLGLDCRKCKWIPYPPFKGKDGHWAWSVTSLPHSGGTYVPEDEYEETYEKIYRERLGNDYDECIKMLDGMKGCFEENAGKAKPASCS